MSRFHEHPVHGQLFSMSFFAWTDVIRRQQELGTATKCVAFALGLYADAQTGGSAYPGQERLASDASMTDRNVRRHLAILEDSGFIVETFRGGRSGDGKRNASIYQLTAPVKLLDEMEAAKVGAAK